MMNLMLDSEVFQCEDGSGNGCGLLLDGLVVERVGKLCKDCAAQLPTEEI